MMKKLLSGVITATLLVSAGSMAQTMHNTVHTTGKHAAHSAPAEKQQQSEKTKHSQSVKTNELFTVSLPGNPTTGYTWRLRTLPPRVSLVSTEYKQSDECKPGMTGCSGQQVFTFKAEEAGKGEIELVYGRAWEKEWAQTHTEQVEIADGK